MDENQTMQRTGESVLDFSTIPDMKKRAMLFALKKSLGIVSQAAKTAGISRETHYYWLKNDKDYEAACKLVNESAIDFAESKLFELINGVSIKDKDGTSSYILPPNTAATIFFLKTKAKHRGYIERIQLQDLGDDEVDSTLEF